MTTSRFPRSLVTVLVFAACSMTMTSPARAGRTYYVDTNNPAADDHGPGTQAVPFKTIQHAVKQLWSSGNTVLVEPGVYYEKVALVSQGAAGDTNVVRADGPGVVVDGSRPVPAGSWTQGPGTTWYFTGAAGAVVMDGVDLPFTSASADSMPAPSWHEDAMGIGDPVYVNLGGEDPRTHDVRYAQLDQDGFIGHALAYLRVEGFTVRNCGRHGIYIYSGAHVELRNNVVHHTGFAGILALGQYMNDAHINGNHVQQAGLPIAPAHGIMLESIDGAYVEDNELDDNSGAGIKLDGTTSTLVRRNRCHDNGDDGVTLVGLGSNSVVLNLCYANRGHGFELDYAHGDLLDRNVAFANHGDGVSLEGGCIGNALHNTISLDNGLGNAHYDLFVADSSANGLSSDDNLIWNSTPDVPVKYLGKRYSLVAGYADASGHDRRSVQADPRLVDGVSGNFQLQPHSPAIDRGNRDTPGWVATGGVDFNGRAPLDDPASLNLGGGTGDFADIGAFEFVPQASNAVGPTPAGGLALSIARPNPSRGMVTLALTLPRAADVSWQVLDVAGRHMWSAAPARRPAGETLLRWQPADRAAPGIYVIRVDAAGTTFARRAVIVK